MADIGTTVSHDTPIEIRKEPVEVVVGTIPADEHLAVDQDDPRTAAIRDLLSRQLEVGHDLGAEIIDAATTVSVAVAQAPASLIGEIRGGATLPTAIAQSGNVIREVITTTGSTLRTAVGDFVGHQATLPNAVVVGVSDVAGTLLHAQGKVATAAIDATLAIATVVVDGGGLQDVADRERRAVGASTGAARDAIGQSWNRARQEIRSAADGFDEALVD